MSSPVVELSTSEQTDQLLEYESDVEADLEVDQLDSDTDAETDANASKKKSPSGERIPGSSLLPAMRLENIIQAEGVTGNLALSREGLFVLSIATEEFIQRLVQAGHLQASSQRRNMVSYSDMAVTTQQYQEFMFLRDTVPPPVSLKDALLLREAKERELLEEDPAMATSFPIPSSAPTPDARSTISNVSNATAYAKSKSPVANGKEKQVNGDAHESASYKHEPARSGPSSHVNAGAQSLVEPQATGPTLSLPDVNHRGTSCIGNGSTSGSTSRSSPSSLQQNEGALQPTPSHSLTPPLLPPQEESAQWPAQFTGPASGFLQGPAAPFGRPTQNPGRTIYTQTQDRKSVV